MIGQTKLTRRAIMGVLSPMLGTRATGTVVVTAAAGQTSVTLPARSFLIPTPASATGRVQLAWGMPFFTTAAATITTAGVDVAVTSLLGGVRMNLAKDTALRFDPPLAGLVQVSTVKATLTGGANSTAAPGVVRDIVAYESFETQAEAQDVFLARAGDRIPAIVLAWTGSGGVEPRGHGPGTATDTWKLYVVTAHGGGAHPRSDQALDILDAMRDYLTDRSGMSGIIFSAPPTVVLGRDLLRVTPSSTVYSMTIKTTRQVRKADPHAGTQFGDWDWTQVDLDTATTVPLPVVDDAVYPMS